jgi:hypothetical protein
MMGEPTEITLDPQWLNQLGDELEKDYMHSLHEFLATRQQQDAVIYPPQSQWFTALNSTPFDKVKGGDFRAGSLPWPRSGSWTLFFL